MEQLVFFIIAFFAAFIIGLVLLGFALAKLGMIALLYALVVVGILTLLKLILDWSWEDIVLKTDIVLTSDTLEVIEIKKKTKAEMFKSLKVGDKILLSIPVKTAGSNRGTYASYIKVENLQNGECTYKSFNQIVDILNLFEFKAI